MRCEGKFDLDCAPWCDIFRMPVSLLKPLGEIRWLTSLKLNKRENPGLGFQPLEFEVPSNTSREYLSP